MRGRAASGIERRLSDRPEEEEEDFRDMLASERADFREEGRSLLPLGPVEGRFDIEAEEEELALAAAERCADARYLDILNAW